MFRKSYLRRATLKKFLALSPELFPEYLNILEQEVSD
jgi:hypothetical protein